MMNLFYRGYVIHEDIRSICYTIFGSKPTRTELGTRATAMDAMKWVDHELVRLASLRWVRRDAVKRQKNAARDPVQPALL